MQILRGLKANLAHRLLLIFRIERQTQALMPGSYFLITFTLLAELRELVWQHQPLL